MTAILHTPGPWILADDGWIIGSDGTTVADPHCDKQDIDEREANAHLIAAAPELLECLQLAYEWLRNLSQAGCCLIDAQPYAEKAGLEWFRRAIVKANGGCHETH